MPTTVQHRSAFGNSVASIALAFLSNNTAGNLLVYCGAGTPVDIGGTEVSTDNNSNAILDSGLHPTVHSQGALRLYYVKSCNGGANTVTLTDGAASSDGHLHIAEVSGCDPTAPFNASGTLVTGTSASYSVSTSGASAASD